MSTRRYQPYQRRVSRSKNILSLLLMAVSAAIVYMPGGLVRMATEPSRRDLEYLRIMAKSPLHQICALCDNPATHQQDYTITGTGVSGDRTYYFCDRHWPPPKEDVFGRLQVKTVQLNRETRRTGALVVFSFLYGLMLFFVLVMLFQDSRIALFFSSVTIVGAVGFWLLGYFQH